MGKLVVFTSVTLDGVMQAPGRPDEDTRGGFPYGGWGLGYNDAVMGGFLAENMARPGSLVLGRRTYEDLYGYWPRQTDNPFTEVLNRTRKYVASATLAEPLGWSNSTLLAGDAADAVAALKREPVEDLMVIGSGELVQALRRRDLVDEYVLLIHPLVLGTGRRLFPDGGGPATLGLTGSTTTTTGVIIATYQVRRDA
jgi:dihydrofolate reductase